jgi:hypothetical protein
MDLTKKHHIWYVADPTIPVDHPDSGANQRTKSFRTVAGQMVACLMDREIRASMLAGRIRMISIKDVPEPSKSEAEAEAASIRDEHGPVTEEDLQGLVEAVDQGTIG